MAWTLRTSGFGTTYIRTVCFNSGLYVAAGNAGKLATSTDGINWTQRTSSFSASYTINRLCYGNGLFVAAGTSGKLATSTDGINWTQQTSSFGASSIYGLCYGNGLFIAAGTSGKLATSTDGINWTQRTSSFGSDAIYALCYGNGLFVAAGGSGKLATSTDGINWTQRTSSFGSTTINGISYGNGVYVAISNGDKLATSTDGINWTQQAAGISPLYTMYDAAFGNGAFYVVGGNGQVFVSHDDGSTWVQEDAGFGTSTVYGIAYGAGLWVAVGNAGTLSTNAVPIQVLLTPGQLNLSTVGQNFNRSYSDTAAQCALLLSGFAPKTHVDTYKRAPVIGELVTAGQSPVVSFGLKLLPTLKTLFFVAGMRPAFANRLLYLISPNWVSTRYRCVLTGSADGLLDIDLPIKSFQTRFTDNYIYFSAVLPGVDQFQDAIADRPNGRLVVWRIYDYLDGHDERFVLASVPFETLRVDSGGRSGLTGTLSGNEYNTSVTPQTIELFDPVYYAATDGAKRRYRCRLDPRLRVGDTAVIGDDSLTVGTIIHIVDVKSTLMEIAEA